MKYDQHLLESAYTKIYFKEEISSFGDGEYDPLPNPPQKSEDEIDREIDEEDDRAETNDSIQQVINELGNRIPSENLLKNLNSLSSDAIEELISTLNENEQWVLKDNLIRFLFILKGYEF